MALSIFLSVLITVWIIILYVTTGAFILGRLRCNNGPVAERTVVAAALGFGVVGNLITLFNFLQLASSKGILILLGVLTLACMPQWFTLLRRGIRAKGRYGTETAGRAFTAFPGLTILLVFLFFLFGLRSILPPTGFDALMYHLSSAWLFLDHHGFYHVFFNPQSDYPMLTEMNFMIGLAAGNDLVCRQIDLFICCLACAAMVMLSGRCEIGRKDKLLACILFLSLPAVSGSITSCDVDIAMATWIALSVFMARKAAEEDSTGALVAAAFLAGMAMQTKIFGVFVLPVVLLAGPRLKLANWKKTAVLMTIPLVMAAPWYLKSYLHAGTILSIDRSIIASQGLGLPMGVAVDSPPVRFLINVVARILAAPWTFSLVPSQHQQDCLGPLFIAVLPFALLIGTSGGPLMLLKLAGVYLAGILFMEMLFIPAGASIRYLLAVPLFLIPVCLYLVKNLRIRFPGTGRMLTFLMMAQIALGTVLLVKRFHKDWLAILTLKDRHAYYESVLPQYPAIKYVNDLRGKVKVMTIYNYDNYLIQKPYISAYRNYADGDALGEDIRRHSITHLFANDVFDTASNGNAFPQYGDKQIVFARNGFYVYEIDK